MHTYVKKLQSKPEHIRKQILVFSLIVCMAIVGLVWIGSLGYRFGKKNTVEVKEEIKPFALLGQSIKETYSNVTASVGNASFLKKRVSEELKAESQVETEESVETGKQIDLIQIEYQ